MIITHKHRQRAEQILKQGNVQANIDDTLKVLYCLVKHKWLVRVLYYIMRIKKQ